MKSGYILVENINKKENDPLSLLAYQELCGTQKNQTLYLQGLSWKTTRIQYLFMNYNQQRREEEVWNIPHLFASGLDLLVCCPTSNDSTRKSVCHHSSMTPYIPSKPSMTPYISKQTQISPASSLPPSVHDIWKRRNEVVLEGNTSKAKH